MEISQNRSYNPLCRPVDAQQVGWLPLPCDHRRTVPPRAQLSIVRPSAAAHLDISKQRSETGSSSSSLLVPTGIGFVQSPLNRCDPITDNHDVPKVWATCFQTGAVQSHLQKSVPSVARGCEIACRDRAMGWSCLRGLQSITRTLTIPARRLMLRGHLEERLVQLVSQSATRRMRDIALILTASAVCRLLTEQQCLRLCILQRLSGAVRRSSAVRRFSAICRF